MAVGRRNHHASLTKAKRGPKKEKIKSSNDEWKGYLKSWARSSSPIWAPYEPPVAKAQLADPCCVMAYDHKTQSFMKNGGQRKCLDKALHGI